MKMDKLKEKLGIGTAEYSAANVTGYELVQSETENVNGADPQLLSRYQLCRRSQQRGIPCYKEMRRNTDSVYTATTAALKGQLWEDMSFPLDENIGTMNRIYWLRPKEICQHASVSYDGAAIGEFLPGSIGGLNLALALNALRMHPQLIGALVPEQILVHGPDYCGMFHAMFWKQGWWTQVLIDDRLPCSADNEVLGLHTSEPSELWPALLEKAYAKFCGGYEKMRKVVLLDVLVDLTGGYCERFVLERNRLQKSMSRLLQPLNKICCITMCSKLQGELTQTALESPKAFFDSFVENLSSESIPMQTISTDSSSESSPQIAPTTSRYKLTRGAQISTDSSSESSPHIAQTTSQYTLTRATQIRHRGKCRTLLLCRGTSMQSQNFGSNWSPDSPTYKLLDESQKSNLSSPEDQQNEFWVDDQELSDHFTQMIICYLTKDSVTGDPYFSSKVVMNQNIFFGLWNEESAGGIRSNPRYHKNPQFFLRLSPVRRKGPQQSAKTQVHFSLMQEAQGDEYHLIGMDIYMLQKVPTQKFDRSFFRLKNPLFMIDHAIKREVQGTYVLKFGLYLLVPNIDGPISKKKFSIRVITYADSVASDGACAANALYSPSSGDNNGTI